jgi:archaellum component FlaC
MSDDQFLQLTRQITGEMALLGGKLDGVHQEMRDRFDEVDKRFEQVDKRFDRVEERLTKLEEEVAIIKADVKDLREEVSDLSGHLVTEIEDLKQVDGRQQKWIGQLAKRGGTKFVPEL